MHPILISIGGINIFSFSVLIILAWLTFSFTFWFMMKSYGIPEERVFDISFYGTFTAALFARLFFVITNYNLFRDNLLKIITVWIVPGLSKYGAIFGFLLLVFFYAKAKKVRLGYVADSLAFAILASFTVGAIGSFLDGTQVGKPANLKWAVIYSGYVGYRHPVQIYDILVYLIIAIVLTVIWKKSVIHKWPYGMIGIWFFLLFSLGDFVIEFFRSGSVYFSGLSIVQWITLAIASECLGTLYVRFGGRQKISKAFWSIKNRLSALFRFVSRRIAGRKN